MFLPYCRLKRGTNESSGNGISNNVDSNEKENKASCSSNGMPEDVIPSTSVNSQEKHLW